MTLKHVCPICNCAAVPRGIDLNRFSIWKCEICGLHFAPEAFEVNVDYEKIYDSEEYKNNQIESLFALIDSRQYIHHGTYVPFFEQVKPLQDARLLDVGCGVGLFCHAAHASGWEVTGIDVSGKAVQIGRERAAFRIHKLNVQEMAERKEHFDVVTAFEVLEHLNNPKKFIFYIREILKPGGTFFCTVPNWDCSDVQRSTRVDWLPPIHLLFFSRMSLQSLARISGFSKIRTGLIWTDPFPRDARLRLKWLGKRVLRKRNLALGLWMICSNK